MHGMQTVASTPSPPGTPYRFTVDEYLRMAETGLIAPDVRTELVDGQVVVMSPKNLPHIYTKNTLRRWLERALADERRWEVVDQDTMRAAEQEAPEPDIAVVPAIRPPLRRRAVPEAAEALLVVEVADTTLTDDLGRKRLLYARAGVPHYWVADVNAARLHLFADPRDGDYRQHDQVGAGDVVPLPRIGGRIDLPVDSIFGEIVD
jgi:Uma2 family endonuclease